MLKAVNVSWVALAKFNDFTGSGLAVVSEEGKKGGRGLFTVQFGQYG